jgi:hypothetical protein
VGVENVGRSMVSIGHAKVGMFMSKPLPWVVVSYRSARLRLLPHERP